jgi:hypothetical protein
MHAGGKALAPRAGQDSGLRAIAGLFENLEESVQIGKGERITGLRPIEGDPPDTLILAKVHGRSAEITVCH